MTTTSGLQQEQQSEAEHNVGLMPTDMIKGKLKHML